MAISMKKLSRDEIRIGEHAPAQPLSGTHVVSRARVKGYGGMSVVRAEADSDPKKAEA